MSIRTARAAGLPAVALVAALALTGCSDDSPDDVVVDTGTTGETADPPADAEDPEATEPDADATDDGTDDAEDPEATEPDASDPTSTGLQAIATAEADAGGTAFSVDKDNRNDVWEVEVATGGDAVEVYVDATGTEVRSTERTDLDSDERQALESAEVSLAEAIQRVVSETGGTLDDAEIDEDDGVGRWDVTVVNADGAEEDYLVDITTGDVTRDDD